MADKESIKITTLNLADLHLGGLEWTNTCCPKEEDFLLHLCPSALYSEYYKLGSHCGDEATQHGYMNF